MLKVADALAAAHDKGLIHRDFKPDNVMVDTQNEPHVIDFGIVLDANQPTVDADRAPEPGAAAAPKESKSALAARLTTDGLIVGTPAYMAPEQRVAGASAAMLDQFAFCVTFFELLYGKRPHKGASCFSDLDSIVHLSDVPNYQQRSAPYDHSPPRHWAACRTREQRGTHVAATGRAASRLCAFTADRE